MRRDGASRKSSEKVLEGLGFDDVGAMETEVKTKLHRELLAHIRTCSFTQAQLAEMLGIHQPDVSKFLNGHVAKFSIGQLIRFAGRLSMEAQISVRPSGRRPVQSASSGEVPLSRRVKAAR